MEFNISFLEGTDSIKFGMRRDEVQCLLGMNPILFKKNPHDIYLTEDYGDICHVFYDEDCCVAFEFYASANLRFDGLQLLEKKREDIEPYFVNMNGYERDTEGFRIHNGDFGIYAPEGLVESVYLAKKGHFEKELEYFTKLYDEEKV
jgi:hypothetical protein